jgi:hypothetical protein
MKRILIICQVLIPLYLFSQDLVSITPSTANAGQTLNVTITGSATHFTQGSGTSIYFGFEQGTGTTVVNSQNVLSNTSIRANITVPSNVYTGNYDVYTYNSIDGDLDLSEAFHVNGLTPPSLTSINPSSAMAGQTLNVTITGSGTHFTQGTETTISFGFEQGTGTTVVNSQNILSNTSIMANITVPANTLLGDYDVYVDNYVDGELLLMGGFHVGVVGFAIYNDDNLLLKVYPNPARNLLTVKIKKTKFFQNPLLGIYDLKGKLLMEQPINKENTEIDINSLKEGVYLIKMSEGKNTKIVKFLKN